MKKVAKCAYLQVSTVPEFERLVYRTMYYLKSEGLLPTLRQIMKIMVKRTGLGFKTRPKTDTTVLADSMNLNAGDVVVVKSVDEIRETLDLNDKTKGLLFMPEMWKYCGKQFVVYKRVSTILVESTGKIRHPKNTVLLTHVHCDGSEHFNCDSSCFHYWREAWLKRVDDASGENAAPDASTPAPGGNAP
jgi:hypothetical protein